MRKTAVFKNELFIQHDPGHGHPESPERLKIIYDYLNTSSLTENLVFPDTQPASEDKISQVHASSTLEAAKKTAGKVYDVLDNDTITSKDSYNAALHAAGSVIDGIDMLQTGQVKSCLALVRPPGHHAESDRSMGFCLFNNIAVGAQHAIDEHGLERILIFDWDVHHGNGTQNSFYESNKVLFMSAHQFPLYPGSGSNRESGAGKGEGYTINIPMPPGMGDIDYAAVINQVVAPVAECFEPQLILISAGFDTFIDDPLGSMEVTQKGYRYMTRRFVEMAEKYCSGKILVTLEGGYSMRGQQEGAIGVLEELMGRSTSDSAMCLSGDEYDKMKGSSLIHPSIAEAASVAKKYWKM